MQQLYGVPAHYRRSCIICFVGCRDRALQRRAAGQQHIVADHLLLLLLQMLLPLLLPPPLLLLLLLAPVPGYPTAAGLCWADYSAPLDGVPACSHSNAYKQVCYCSPEARAARDRQPASDSCCDFLLLPNVYCRIPVITIKQQVGGC